MARVLPWTIDHAPPPKRQRTLQTPRADVEKASSPAQNEVPHDEHDTPDRGRRSNATLKRTTNLRTPSSSPTRAPPSTELMHEGYEADDIYIMVEDEFYTVAQTYTAHLHLAEYKRLVKQAREAPPKALPEPKSPMSRQAKQRLKSDALQLKQKDALQKVLGSTMEAEEEEEEDKVADLWSGTSLAPLMAGGNQEKTSLLGLERMSSNTKAGMGFVRPPGGSGSSGRDLGHGDLARAATTSGTSSARAREKGPSFADAISSTGKTNSSRMSSARRPDVLADGISEPLRVRSVSSEVQAENDHETSVPSRNDSGIRRPRPTPKANGSFLKRKLDKEQEKRSRLEEIPMFII
ncbi:hypothetical protein LTR72_004506 [Exophiala xenobiotica]|nr:hypothetical protein LTR72_004506 [Exophiala xenobiotica]KAK5293808.1 hypothetical protein LTR14_004699 [Exophiala xenobiotica]KAK5496861.1 hypothetical protein LTR55_001351 [Exophiala xenobiotica]